MMDIREKLAKVRCFLLDMDGTFYLGNQLIEGSLDFLAALRRTGRQCLFLTNNSSKSASFYQQKLERMVVPAEFRNVICVMSFPPFLEFHRSGSRDRLQPCARNKE